MRPSTKSFKVGHIACILAFFLSTNQNTDCRVCEIVLRRRKYQSLSSSLASTRPKKASQITNSHFAKTGVAGEYWEYECCNPGGEFDSRRVSFGPICAGLAFGRRLSWIRRRHDCPQNHQTRFVFDF